MKQKIQTQIRNHHVVKTRTTVWYAILKELIMKNHQNPMFTVWNFSQDLTRLGVIVKQKKEMKESMIIMEIDF